MLKKMFNDLSKKTIETQSQHKAHMSSIQLRNKERAERIRINRLQNKQQSEK